jgi:hypothetical protein
LSQKGFTCCFLLAEIFSAKLYTIPMQFCNIFFSTINSSGQVKHNIKLFVEAPP